MNPTSPTDKTIYVQSPAGDASIEKIKKEIQSPAPLICLEDLNTLITPKPKFVGPGSWLNVIKESLTE